MTRWLGPLSDASRLRAGLAVGVVVLIGVALAALLFLSQGLLPAGLLAALVAGAAAVLALWRLRAVAAQGEKLSAELDLISQRLLALEARSPTPASAEPDPELRESLAEVTGEIALLGSLVRDLAVTVAGHDRALAGARDEARPAPAPRPESERPTPREPPSRPALVSVTPEDRPVPAGPPPRPEPPPEREPERPDPRAEAILAAFRADQIEVHLQPVVSLPQRRTRFYEALARLRLSESERLVPAEFMPVLEREGLVPDLDRKVLARSTAVARHLSSRGSDAFVCCNLAPASLQASGFLRAIGRLVEGYPDLPRRLVLEISQQSWRSLDAERAGALAALRDAGLSFSLDRAADLRFDPPALAERGVRYVKVPAALLLQPGGGGSLDLATADLAVMLRRAGLQLVAERVEREEDVPDLIELDVPLAQGFVFAPPRAVRAEVLAARPGPSPEPVPPPVPVPEAAPQRLPFRAFLRRAG